MYAKSGTQIFMSAKVCKLMRAKVIQSLIMQPLMRKLFIDLHNENVNTRRPHYVHEQSIN